MNPFASKVNFVRMESDSGRAFVRKIYGPCALGTGIPIPDERRIVEARVLDLLFPISEGGQIKVPRVIDIGTNYLDIELINHRNAFQNLPFHDQVISSPLWHHLGVWLRTVEVKLHECIALLYRDLWEVQAQCASILNTLKTPALHIENIEKHTVSLGDVGLKNLIITPDLLYAIDFEFCHVSLPGRDAGQLCSQLAANREFAVMNQVEAGYTQAGGRMRDLSFWKTAFGRYYGRPD